MYDNGVISRAQAWKKKDSGQGTNGNEQEEMKVVGEQKDDFGRSSASTGPGNGSSSALELHKHTSYTDWLTAEAEAFRSSPMLKRQKVRFESQRCYAWEESDGGTALHGPGTPTASERHAKEPVSLTR